MTSTEPGAPPEGVMLADRREDGCLPKCCRFLPPKSDGKTATVPRRWTHGQGCKPWTPIGPHRGRGPKVMKGEASPPRSDKRFRGAPAPKVCRKTADERFNIAVAEMWKM